MKKIFFFILISIFVSAPVLATTSNQELMAAIKKYKSQNFVGCIQDLEIILKKDPSNAVAQYYYAISNVNIGKKEPAMDAYSKVVTLDTTQTLKDYAQKGLGCLQTPDSCSKSSETDLDRFINSQGTSFSKDVSKSMQEKDLNQIKDQINKSLKQKSELPQSEKKASAPTNDEIAEAVKTLSRAGVASFGQIQPDYQMANNIYQSPEYSQLQMLMGNNNNRNNDNFSNMLPYIMNQNNASGNKNNLPPEMIKSMMMSSMMGDFSLGSDDNNKGY